MFGHQVVAHLVDKNNHPATNSVDGDEVPASHFGSNFNYGSVESIKTAFTAI